MEDAKIHSTSFIGMCSVHLGDKAQDQDLNNAQDTGGSRKAGKQSSKKITKLIDYFSLWHSR